MIAVPLGSLEEGRAVAQLFSFKTREGRSPAFSALVPLDTALRIPDADFVLPESSEMEQVLHTPTAFRHSRAVPCRTHAEQFSAPALGDLLTQLVKVAAPVVMGFLQQPPAGGAVTPPAAGAGAGATPPAAGGGDSPRPSWACSRRSSGRSPASRRRARPSRSLPPRRRPTGSGKATARRCRGPFIFGIDDVLIGAAIGQVVGCCLSSRTRRAEARPAAGSPRTSCSATSCPSVQRRMLLQQVLDAQAPGARCAAAGHRAARGAARSRPARPAVQSLAAPPAQSQSLALQVRRPPPRAHGPLRPSSQLLRSPGTGASTCCFPKAGTFAWMSARRRRAGAQHAAPEGDRPRGRQAPADQSVVAEQVVKQRDLPPARPSP